MRKCEKCDTAMAAVLKREGGQSMLVYECPGCESDERKDAPPPGRERD
jgi:hypothetical protein